MTASVARDAKGGLGGPNGIGKTTLLSIPLMVMVQSLSSPTSGRSATRTEETPVHGR